MDTLEWVVVFFCVGLLVGAALFDHLAAIA
jgi:hypothetical protein